jgi:hypothetical protein
MARWDLMAKRAGVSADKAVKDIRLIQETIAPLA